MPAEMTDARGFRSGAAISVGLLAVALLSGGSPLLVATIGAAMLLSAATRLRISLLALPFRLLRARGLIGAPRPEQLQPVPGLRLAQLLGGSLLLGAIPLDAAGIEPLAVLLVILVTSLQSFLAITGICIACKLYGVVMLFEGRRSAPLPIAATSIRILDNTRGEHDAPR